MVLISQIIEKAVADHKNGNLQAAKQNYQEVLRAEPRHVDANHNLV